MDDLKLEMINVLSAAVQRIPAKEGFNKLSRSLEKALERVLTCDREVAGEDIWTWGATSEIIILSQALQRISSGHLELPDLYEPLSNEIIKILNGDD
jgi:hypothetical protein